MLNEIEFGGDYDLIEPERLRQNDYNVRRVFRRIEALADSIEEHGLLQNLVVHPDDDGRFIVRAGARRLAAIELLNREDRRPKVAHPKYLRGQPVACLVLEGSRQPDFANVVENLQRENIPPWDLGFRYNVWLDSGMTQEQIAAKLGTTQGHVSFCSKVARAIHPEVIKRMARLPDAVITRNTLSRMCALVSTDGDPLCDKQLALLDFALSNPRARKRKLKVGISPPEMLRRRFNYLRRVAVPPEHHRAFCIVMAYLSGSTSELDWQGPTPMY